MKHFISLLKGKYIFGLLLLLICQYVYFEGFKETYNLQDESYLLRGDAVDYVYSCENLIDRGEYTFFVNAPNLSDSLLKQKIEQRYPELKYSFRMPGFAIFYVPLRLFFDQDTALFCFIILQILILTIAIVLGGRLFEVSLGDSMYYYIFVGLFALTPILFHYNNLLINDSLGISFLIFSFYSIYFWINSYKVSWGIVVGVNLMILVFLRPFYIVLPFILYFFLLFFKKQNSSNLKRVFVPLVVFMIPLSLWTARNYFLYEKVVFLQSSNSFKLVKGVHYPELFKLGNKLGLPPFDSNINSLVYFYDHKEARLPKSSILNKDTFLQNELLLLRSRDFSDCNKEEVASFIQPLHQYLNDNYWYEINIEGPVDRFFFYVRHPKDVYPFQFKNWPYPFNLFYVLAFQFIAILSLVLAAFGLLYAVTHLKNILSFLILSLFLFISVLFTVIFSFKEYRFSLYFSLLILFLALLGIKWINKSPYGRKKVIIYCFIVLFVSPLVYYQSLTYFQ